MAPLLNVPVNEVVLVKNATTGVHTVLHNLNFQRGDAIVYFDTVYGAIDRMLVSMTEHTPVQTRKVDFRFPLSIEDLVKGFVRVVQETRKEGLNVRVAVLETVISMPGVRFPFERVLEVCRELGVLSLVDGAHGIGHLPLDLGSLKPDFFTSNCHKYFFLSLSLS